MYHFIKVFDVNYVSVGINKNTKRKYYVFPKSEKAIFFPSRKLKV